MESIFNFIQFNPLKVIQMKQICTFSNLMSCLGALLFAVILTACNDQKILDLQPLETPTFKSNRNARLADPKAELGRLIFFDTNLSEPVGAQSCSSCHMPGQGFAGMGDVAPGGLPRGFVGGIAEGAVAGRFGNRLPPSAAYAAFSPILSFNLQDQEFQGGLFWDGRATGTVLGSPAADQSLGPFLNSLEQNHPDFHLVLQKISSSAYADQWQAVWGSSISTATSQDLAANCERLAKSIEAYELSSEVNPFSSKFDAYTRGETQLTAQEMQGLTLFNGKAECYDCHESKVTGPTPALFTNYEYFNIGVPKNPLNPVYRTNPKFIDYGLGGFLDNQPNRAWKSKARASMGKFKTPTVRNVAKGTNRRFMHNGVFNSLEQVVSFYNTRSVRGAGWGAPEVAVNVTGHNGLGKLGLTASEEAAIVAFLKTLSDGWQNN
jgi:cytochrome c peroxidase